MNVLSLVHTDLATDEDIRDGLVNWADAFNAKTYEELSVIANKDPVFAEVTDMIYTIDADEQTSYLLEARQRYREQKATMEGALALAEAERNEAIKKLESTSAELNATAKELDATAKERDAAVEKLRSMEAEIERLRKLLNEQSA